jgi:catalase (peroxidase I)
MDCKTFGFAGERADDREPDLRHGGPDPHRCLGLAPAVADLRQQGFGRQSPCGSGQGAGTVTSGQEAGNSPPRGSDSAVVVLSFSTFHAGQGLHWPRA